MTFGEVKTLLFLFVIGLGIGVSGIAGPELVVVLLVLGTFFLLVIMRRMPKKDQKDSGQALFSSDSVIRFYAWALMMGMTLGLAFRLFRN